METCDFSTSCKEKQTLIPHRHNLPDLDKNEREGNVIKPIEPAFFNDGSRVIFKDKNQKFLERGRPIHMQVANISEELQMAIDNACSYVVQERYDTMISKIGAGSPQRLAGFLAKDALDAFKKEYEGTSLFPKESLKIINTLVSKAAAELVSRNQKAEELTR